MDLNGDNIDDIVAGSYTGDILMYAGRKDGKFNAPVSIEQGDDITAKGMANFRIYQFTSCSFGDYNNDGLLDAFVGGAYGVRVMINVGTKTEPKFSKRTPLLTEDGLQIDVIKNLPLGSTARDYKSFPQFIDWDNDGVMDIIATPGGSSTNVAPISFFKGVQHTDGLRFKDAVSLIEYTNACKALPGQLHYFSFCDYNKDGVRDILMGTTQVYDPVYCNFYIDKNYNGTIDENGNFIVDTRVQATDKGDPKYKWRGYVLLLEGVEK